MTNINQNLMNFINQTPNAYFCAQNLRKKLIENGFVELYENQSWDNLTDNGKYFVVRNVDGESFINATFVNYR